MGLALNVKSCIENNCTKLQITDITGLTSVPGDGSNKWNDTVPRGMIEATINIILPNGSNLTAVPIDVTSIVMACTTDYIYFSPLSPTGDKFVDGIYTIEYSVLYSDINTTYSISNQFSITCNYECCVSGLWANLPAKMCATCDYEDYLNMCLEAQALLNALKYAACCGNVANFTNISALLDKICASNVSDCGCS